MKYIPLANLKNTTGIVAFCKEANEIVVANRNGQPKLVLMSREVYENGLGKLVYSDQIEHTARRFSAGLPPIQCTLSGHQSTMIIQG